jgi:hypothetical protein
MYLVMQLNYILKVQSGTEIKFTNDTNTRSTKQDEF